MRKAIDDIHTFIDILKIHVVLVSIFLYSFLYLPYLI